MIWLLAADNPGAANVLACLFAPARARGHQLLLRPSGAAMRVWQAEAEASFPEAVDVLVTGTGFADFERLMWREAARRGVPSLAVVEAWMNLERRFRMTDGTWCWPDVVAVPDADVRDGLRRFAPADVAIEVVGQPHLEAGTARLKAARADWRPGAPPLLAWVSEPVAEDYPGGTRGFDQYQVFRDLMAVWPAGARLLVCPHPREDRALWQRLGPLASRPTAELLAEVDGVIGMTSMVLVEAVLAGIPAVSLQPGRTGALNPVVDRLCPPVTEGEAIGPAIAGFLQSLDAPPVAPGMDALLDGATTRLLDLVERVASLERCHP